MKKGDIVIIVLLVIVAIGLSQWLGFSNAASASEVQIIQDGVVIEKYIINNDFKKTVDVEYEGYRNTILIENGEVRMQNANCPDQLCVKSHAISKDGEMIVCLPHRLYVKVVAPENGEIDIISS